MIGDRTRLIVAVVTVVVVVFNWVCTRVWILKYSGTSRHPRRRYLVGILELIVGGTSRYIFGSRQHTGVDGAWEMRKAQVYTCRTITGCVPHCSMYT